jgi:hypothetical protein
MTHGRNFKPAARHFAEEAYAPAAREILAKHIIEAAQGGERNPRRLTGDALLHLARQALSKKPPA